MKSSELNSQTHPDTKTKAFFGVTIYAVIIIAILFFAYNAARAWFVNITHDEAFTFNEYVRAQLYDIVNVHGSNSNNHVLNTLVIKLIYSILGNHWFIIRLHSVLLYGVYMYFGYKLLRFVKSNFLVFFGFILLSANPFLFDFFSLARGYLPALVCTLASLYYAIIFLQGNQIHKNHLWKALIIAALAVFFHLSFLNYFVPFCGLLFLYIAWPKNASAYSFKTILKNTWPVLLVLVLVVAYSLPVSLWIKKLGEMELAGKTGFWIDTVQSLIYYSLYDQPYVNEYNIWLLSAIVAGFLALAAIILLIFLLRKKPLPVNLSFIAFLLVLIYVCIAVQHLVLDNPFPNVRLALFFVPIFWLLVVYSLDQVNRFYFGSIISFLLAAVISYHFINSANFYKTMNWASDADTYEMLSVLKTEAKNASPKEPARLGIEWIDEPNINYYRIEGKKYWLRSMSREGFLPNDEYIYASADVFKRFNKNAVQTIKTFDRTGHVLARNLYADSLPLLTEKQLTLGAETEIKQGKSCDALIFNRDEIKTDSILVVATARVKVKYDYVGGNFVISADSLADNQNIWKSIKVSDAIIEPNQWQQISFSTIISLKNQPKARINSYIWNTGKMPLYLNSFEIKLYDLRNAKPLMQSIE